jgi:two-component system chemotaxis sensor kinase CheA
MSNQNMTQFLGIFIDEGREQITLLEAGFLNLEKGEADPNLLQDVFRAAHTLKGSSRAMGYSTLGDLTHRMEDVLDRMRQGEIGASEGLVSVMLRCTDALKVLMDQVAASGAEDSSQSQDFESLISELGGLLSGGTPDVTNPIVSPQPTASSIPAAGVLAGSVNLTVTLTAECGFPGARAAVVLALLEEIGDLHSTAPSRDVIEDGGFGHSFQLSLLTSLAAEDVAKKVRAIGEVAEVTLTPVEPPTVVAKAASAAAAKEPAAPSNQTIRVGVNRLDALLNLVGELVTERTQMASQCAQLKERFGSDDLAGHLSESTLRIARITGELQDEIMKTRMLPLDNVFQRMPRVVRDIAQSLGKHIKLDILGGETEIDRSLIDALGDPLIHLLRNSVDHGVESPEARAAAGKPEEGLVRLTARHEENHIMIEVRDDGAGINAARLKQKAIDTGLISKEAGDAMPDSEAHKLIFAPGLSTAKEVSAISGRGVGMDIVKTNLEKIGGRVSVESEPGKGTRFSIRLPLTLAIMRSLLVEASNVTYALPLSYVVETLRLGTETSARREKLSGRSAMVLRGETVPLSHLQSILSHRQDASRDSIAANSHVVVVGAGGARFGLCVDKLKGEQEVVIKPLGGILGEINGISGASILGDGSVALIVDPAKALAHAA